MNRVVRPAAMLLAAGLGTRLSPLTDEIPKPLVWLGDRPLIDGILAQLAAQGFERFVANTHHLADRFDEAWLAAQPARVRLVHEPRILGTGGGVANAAGLLGGGDVLVWNADIAADLDADAVLGAHARAGEVAATLVTGPRLAARAGTLGLDAEGRVVRVRAFDRGGEASSADYAGIAVLSERLRERLPAEGCLVGDGFVPALERGAVIATVPLPKPFSDLGTPRVYLDANVAWLHSHGLTSYVAPDATVSDEARSERTIVARGARVVGQGTLEEVVVWPGATAHAPLRRAIVTPLRVVTPG